MLQRCRVLDCSHVSHSTIVESVAACCKAHYVKERVGRHAAVSQRVREKMLPCGSTETIQSKCGSKRIDEIGSIYATLAMISMSLDSSIER
jgi:hypothetical protein